MVAAKPSLDLLRSLTDEHVLRAFMAEERLTRAELATRTGISKPTVSDSVRRLTDAGMLIDTGERTTGRGRIGTYYALSAEAGCALVVSVAPEGVVAEVLDARGVVRDRAVAAVTRPARPAEVEEAITATVRRITSPSRLLLGVVSAADPIDRESGRLVHLPDAPFLIGDLAPAEALAAFVDGPILVDNDVNWAAQAERAASPEALDDFAYLHLGNGLGCAIVSDGDVRRGHHGFAGEIAHVITAGPDGRATTFTDVFGLLGLRVPGSAAIDVAAITAAAPGPAGAVVTEAICGVLAALVTVADPEIVLLGGDWGGLFLGAVNERFARFPRSVPVRPARLTHEPSLAGARTYAVTELRSALVGHVANP